MEQTESKLKLEGEILALKREYKYALENLNRVKVDTAEIISTKERITKEIGERNEDLNKILNEISEHKLTWALEQQGQMDEISIKKAEADKILERKGELDIQEEKIKKIASDNVEVRNETRRLELKIKEDQTALKVKERELEEERGQLEKEKIKIQKGQSDFKKKVSEVLKEVENL